MPENKITYISKDAEYKANIINIDAAVNAAVKGFLKGEPIDGILGDINDGTESFNNWVYDNDIFQNLEYAWLISEEEIFMPDEDIFEYYDRETLDLKTDKDILNFMHSAIDSLCEYRDACHYELYKGVYISATCECRGQGGLYWRYFNIYKSEEEFWEACEGDIISSDMGIQTPDAELISMFKKQVTDKYF